MTHQHWGLPDHVGDIAYTIYYIYIVFNLQIWPFRPNPLVAARVSSKSRCSVPPVQWRVDPKESCPGFDHPRCFFSYCSQKIVPREDFGGELHSRTACIEVVDPSPMIPHEVLRPLGCTGAFYSSKTERPHYLYLEVCRFGSCLLPQCKHHFTSNLFPGDIVEVFLLAFILFFFTCILLLLLLMMFIFSNIL